MSVIHQIYCIQAAHRESAASGDQGEAAQQASGNRIWASSLDGEELQRHTTQIERLFVYAIPPDTTADQKAHLTAATAPRRLVFVPRADGWQLLAQVCYRPAEGTGAGNASFTHLVLRGAKLQAESQPMKGQSAEPNAEAGAQATQSEKDWSVLDCLKLWGAPGWVQSDAPERTGPLPPLNVLTDLLCGGTPTLDDAVFLSFLKEPGDSPAFCDPAKVISERWRAMEPERRRNWFAEAFSRFLQAEGEERKPVVVVVEPGVAAVLFYGIARLLPSGPTREEISFSTFETEPGQVASSLAATWYSDPEAAARQPDARAWPGPVVNTLVEPGAEQAPKAKYASYMIQKLCEKGWEAVDAKLKSLAAASIRHPGDLEILAAVQRAVVALLERGSFPNESWRSSPVAMRFLMQELTRRVAAMEDPAEGLKAVVGGSAHLAVIDLLTGKAAPPEVRKAVVHLLKELPPQKIIGLLKLGGVHDDDKITVLGRYIQGNGDLPLGCEFLWEDWAAAGEGAPKPGAVLMARVLSKLPPKVLKKFFRNVPRESTVGFVLNALRMYRQNKLKREAFSAMIQGMDETAVLQLLRSAGSEFLKSYPKDEPALGEKIGELLHTLPKHPLEFKERLRLILAGQHLVADEEYHRAIAAWDTCQQLIPKVASLQKPDAGTSPQMRVTLLVSACRDLAKAADQAMSLESVDQHMTWTQKREALLRIGQEVLGGTPLMLKGPWEHDAILERIGIQFQHHRWPQEPLKKESVKKEANKKEPPPRKLVAPESKSLASTGRGVMLASIGAIVLVTVGFGFLIYSLFFTGPSGSPEKTGRRRPARDKTGTEEPSQEKKRSRAPVPTGLVPSSGLLSSLDPPYRLPRTTAAILAGIPSLASSSAENRDAWETIARRPILPNQAS